MITYNLSWAVCAIFIGMCSYALDRWYGIRLHRGWHNLTHKDPLDPAAEVGFIHNRKAKPRFALAFAMACGLSLISIALGANPALQIITFFVLVPCLMIGFYAGPWFHRFWAKKNAILERVDDLESGKIDLRDEVRQAAISAKEKIVDIIVPGGEEGKNELEKEKEKEKVKELKAGGCDVAVPESSPEPPKPTEPDPEKMFRKFVDE